MKTKLLLLMLLIVAMTGYAQEQDVPETIMVEIGEFKAQDQMFKAEACISKDTSLVYFYCLAATHAHPKTFYYDYMPKVYIACTQTMKDELLKICAKYKEWAETAKINNVGKFQKVIELEFPIVNLSLHKNKRGYPKFISWKNKKFTFSLYDTQKAPSIFCNESFIDDMSQISVSTGLAFNTPDEFEAFVEFLDPEKVKQKIREGKTSLFTQNAPESRTQPVTTLNNEQSTSNSRTSGHRRVGKKRIAQGALDRWRNATREASGVK